MKSAASSRRGALRQAAGVVVESLESRQMLTSVKVNFQTTGTSTPASYVADTGATYASRGNGYTYGWNADNTANMVLDNPIIMIDTKYKTHAKMQPGGVNRTWEISVPNGQYQVKVVAGDYNNTSSVYNVNVEGTQAAAGTPTSYNYWFEKTVVVNVSDGKLTLTNGSGASDQRLAFVEIDDVPSLTAPSSVPTNPVARSASSTAVDLLWSDTTSNEYGFEIQRKLTTGGTFATIATTGGGNEYYSYTSKAFYTDAGLTANTSYTYRLRAVNAAGQSGWSSEVVVATPANNNAAAYGSVRDVTSKIEAEDFDRGGPGYGYTDNSTGNYTNLYRVTDVDVGAAAGGTYFVGWNSTNEWTAYTVNIPTSGTYDLVFNRSRSGAGGTFDILMNGSEITANPIQIEGTGSTFSFAQTTVSGIHLNAGSNLTMKVIVRSTPSGSAEAGNIDWFQFNLVSPDSIAAPTSLATSNVLANSVTLSWTDNATNETNYRVQRKTGSGAWEMIAANLAANTTTYTDTTVAASTAYSYRVFAYAGATESAASNTVTVTTSAASTETVTFVPQADTYVRTGQYENDSYGSVTELVGKLTGDSYHRQMFFRFDASGLTGSVQSVKFRVYGYRNTVGQGNDPANLPFALKPVTSTNWSENITWLTKPTIVSTTLGTINVTSVTPGWLEVDITSHVQTELAAGRTLMSFALVGTYSGSNAAFYVSSREGTTANRPQLQVVQTVTATAPNPPHSLVRGAPLDTGMTLQWSDASSNETGFEISRKDGSGAWTPIHTTSANAVSYTDAGYASASSSDVRYRVRAVNGTVYSSYSEELIIPAKTGAPTIQSVSPIAAALTWTDASSVENSYRVERRIVGDTAWTSVATLAANATSYTDNSVVEGVAYDYRVRALTTTVEGVPSAAAAAVVPLKTPTGLLVTSVIATESGANVSLAWTDVSTHEVTYQVQRAVGGVWSPVTPSLLGTSFLTDSTAAVDAVYDYRIRAVNGTSSAESAWLTTTGISTSPGVPTNLAIAATMASSMSLSWTDNSTTETAYRVERRVTGTLLYSTVSLNLPAGATSYVDEECEEGTQYDYRVRAVNTAGDGMPSAAQSEWTKLNTPSGVNVEAASSTSLRVTWTDASSKEASYEIGYSTSATFASGVTTVTAAANEAEKMLTGLTAGATYYVRVRAINADTSSAYATAHEDTIGALGITRSPAGNPNEGTQLTFTASYASGTAPEGTTYVWAILKNNVAVSSSAVASNGNTATFTPDDNGSYTASVEATTPFGQKDTATLSPSVTVVNVAPSLTAVGDSSVAKEADYALTLTATDPGIADTITWTINWGDDQTENYAGRNLTPTHEYTVAGNYTISISASDGTTSATPTPATIAVEVTEELLPTVILSGADYAVVDEPYLLDISVENAGTPGITSYLIDWGDGSDPDNDSAVGEIVTDISSPIEHIYETTGSYEIHVLADSLYAAEPKDINVIEEQSVPGITLTGNSSAMSGTPYSLSLTTSMPVTGWTINWGDGITETLSGQSSVNVSHTYSSTAESVAIGVSATGAGGIVAAGWKRIALSQPAAGAPPTISSFTAAPSNTLSKEGIDLVWTGSSNAVDYELLRNGRSLGRFVDVATSSADYVDPVVGAGVEYTYSLIAYDASGQPSAPATVTLTAIDRVAPVMSPVLRLTGRTATHTTYEWDPGVDNVGIVSYELRTNPFIDTVVLGTVDSSTHSLTIASNNSSPGPSILMVDPNPYCIVGIDAAGNEGRSMTVDWLTGRNNAAYGINQYVPSELTDYFYNEITASIRARTGPTSIFDRWLPGFSNPSFPTTRAQVLINDPNSAGSLVSADMKIAPLIFQDANEDGVFEQGEGLWHDQNANGLYDDGDTHVSGSTPTSGSEPADHGFSAGLLYIDWNRDSQFDVGEEFSETVSQIGGGPELQEEYAFSDSISMDGTWYSGEAIWLDANHNNYYDAGERSNGAIPIGTWGKHRGLHYYDIGGDSNRRVVWGNRTFRLGASDEDATASSNGLRQSLIQAQATIETLAPQYYNADLEAPYNLGSLLEAAGLPTETIDWQGGLPTDWVRQNGVWVKPTQSLPAGVLEVINWELVPDRAASASEPALHHRRGRLSTISPIFESHIVQLRDVLALMTETVRDHLFQEQGLPVPTRVYPSLGTMPSQTISTFTENALFNEVPDTNDVGTVFRTNSIAEETGFIKWESERELPQAILPVAVSNLTEIPVADYFSTGGFGSSSHPLYTYMYGAEGASDLGTQVADSRNIRAIPFIIDDEENHIKRVTIVRPRGNHVTFDFAWDPVSETYSKNGLVVGSLNADRTYVLHQEPTGAYRLDFDNGLSQSFISFANAVFDRASGLGFSSGVDGKSYESKLNWLDGEIDSIEYTTVPGIYTVGGTKSIKTALHWSDGRIIGLEKTVDGGETVVPQLSYDVQSGGAIDHNGALSQRTGTVAGGTVTIKDIRQDSVESESLPNNGEVSTSTTVNYNSRGLPSSIVLSGTDVTATAATAIEYISSSSTSRNAINGFPDWAQVQKVTLPDQSWTTYEYDHPAGWVTNTESAFGEGSGIQTKIISYDTSAVGNTVLEDRIWKVGRPTIITTLLGEHVVEKIFVRQNEARRMIAVAESASDTWESITYRTEIRPDGVGLATVTSPAVNVVNIITVSGGMLGRRARSWNGNAATDYIDQLTTYTQMAAPGASRSTVHHLNVSPIDVLTGSASSEAFGRPLQSTVNGLSHGNSTYTSSDDTSYWYGPSSVTDSSGVSTTLNYTAWGDIGSLASMGVTNALKTDARGNLIESTVTGTFDGAAGVSSGWSQAFDELGRPTNFINPLEQETVSEYAYNAGTKTWTGTSTYAGNTLVATSTLDGLLRSIGGTSTDSSSYDYGIDATYQPELHPGDAGYVGGGADSDKEGGGFWTKSTDAGGRTTQTWYNLKGQPYRTALLDQHEDPVQNTYIKYDAWDRQEKFIDSDGSVTTYHYDARNGLLDRVERPVDATHTEVTTQKSDWVNDPSRGVVYRTTTKIEGNPSATSTTDVSADGLRSWTASPAGTSTAVSTVPSAGAWTVTSTSPNGSKTIEFYANGVLDHVESRDKANTLLQTLTYGRDGIGRVNAVAENIGGNVRTTGYTLRADGSVARVDYPDGTYEQVLTRNPRTDQPATIRQRDGQVVTVTTNDKGEATKSLGAAIPVASSIDRTTGTYQLGTTRTGEDGLAGNSEYDLTTWNYDEISGLLENKTYANGSEDVFGYDGSNRVNSITRPVSGTAFRYNNAGRLDQTTYTRASQSPITHEVVKFDSIGRVRQDHYTSNGNTVTNWYDYNPAGQLISETQSHLGSGAITYDYYGSGDTGAGQRPLAPRQTTFATSGTPAVQTGYQYDSAGRLWKVSSGTLEVEYGYKAGTTLVNAVTTRQSGTIVATETRTYENATDRLKKIERKNAAGDVVYSIDYTSFSSRDQREGAEVVRRQTNNTVENQTWSWNYDTYGQLIGYTETTNEWETAYDFDEAGNRDGRSANNVNQYANRTYDGNGNQTSDGTWAYAYNALDQMVGATRLDGSERVSYAYDGQGRRVLKETFSGSGGTWTLTTSRKFGYDGTQLIAEYDNTTGTLRRSFTWGIGIGQVGALLSITTYDSNGTVAARYFPYFDGSGNVTGLTDASGAVVATYEYSPFGNLLSSNGTTDALAANPFGFSTMYLDGETGKYHYPYREYDPVDGRWMTRDPIAESGGMNLYAFNSNDPVNNVDPAGLDVVPLSGSEQKWLSIFENFERGRATHRVIQQAVQRSNVVVGNIAFLESEMGSLVRTFDSENFRLRTSDGVDWGMLDRKNLPFKFQKGELPEKRPDIVVFDGKILHVFEIKSLNAGEAEAVREAEGYVRVLNWVLSRLPGVPAAWLGNRLLPGTNSLTSYPTAYGMLTWNSPKDGAIVYRLDPPNDEWQRKQVAEATSRYFEVIRPRLVDAAIKKVNELREEDRRAAAPSMSQLLPRTRDQLQRDLEHAKKDIDNAVLRGNYDEARRLQEYYQRAFNGVEVYADYYSQSEIADLSRIGLRPGVTVRIITDDPNPANWPPGFHPLRLPPEALGRPARAPVARR